MSLSNRNPLTADEILNELKRRIYDSLTTEPWEDDNGNWHNVLDVKGMAAVGGFLIKLKDAEMKWELQNSDNTVKVMAIPALPPIQ